MRDFVTGCIVLFTMAGCGETKEPPKKLEVGLTTGVRESRRLAVAPSAKILVSTGPKEPLALGHQAPEAEITDWYVHVWDLAKGGKSRVLGIQVPEGFALSPDGKWLVTTKGQAIDLIAGTEKALTGLAGVTRVCFSPDGNALLALAGPLQDGVMRVYDWPAMKLRVRLPDQFGYMFAYAFSADSRRVALVDKDRKIRIWNLENGAMVMTTEKAHSNSVHSLALSPDGKRLASSGPKDEIWLWDATTGKRLSVLDGKQDGITAEMGCFVFSSDSKLLVGGGLQYLVLWDVASGQVLQRFDSSSGGAIAAWFSPDETEIFTVNDFYTLDTEGGMYLLVYPSLHHLTVQRKEKASQGKDQGAGAGGKESADAVSKAAGSGKQISNSIGMKLTLVPSGEFMMGSGESEKETAAVFVKDYGADSVEANILKYEHPQHRVFITKPFYLGTYHVTRGQFRQFVKQSGYKTDAEKDDPPGAYALDLQSSGHYFHKHYSWRNTGFQQTDEHAVVCVSWNDAVAFCKWLSKKEDKTYRLPTEAEWEYACRAGTTTRYHSGDDPESLAKVANVGDAAFKAKVPDEKYTIKANDGYVFTAPAGQFNPNAFGLYDMHGNAWQSNSPTLSRRKPFRRELAFPTTSRLRRG